MFALIKAIKELGVPELYLHFYGDGRLEFAIFSNVFLSLRQYLKHMGTIYNKI